MIRAELYLPDTPEVVVAVATWSEGRAHLEAFERAPEGLERLFRPTPVVVDDASLRPLGASGEVMLEPGSLEWFRAALPARAGGLGLAVRFVADEIDNGWDPAANYRTFREQAGRLAAGTSAD
jgi:hypothetical protein